MSDNDRIAAALSVPTCAHDVALIDACTDCFALLTCEERSYVCCEHCTPAEHKARYGYMPAGSEEAER